MEWKKIPKDKDGFFDDESDMYDELPVIVSEHHEGMYPTLHYIDKDNWHETLSDLSRSRFKYYCKCNKIIEL